MGNAGLSKIAFFWVLSSGASSVIWVRLRNFSTFYELEVSFQTEITSLRLSVPVARKTAFYGYAVPPIRKCK